MYKFKPNRNSFLRYLFFCATFLLVVTQSLNAQIAFNQSNLNFNGNGDVSAVTGMTFGPDGRLYVLEYTGAIKILTIQRINSTQYNVTAVETLDGIATIQDHNDDGTEEEPTLFGNPGERETIGIAVGGTAANPVFYVSSSDIRIGAGSNGGNGDVGLDTNSGIITRFSWNGTSWDVVDIVRGLPRSEENHATNGLELATINDKNYLVVAQGGHTNGGSPSINFVLTCEYALSGAVLAIDLDMLDIISNTSGNLFDNGREYIYDIPTLDDPTRPNVNGIEDPNTIGYTGEDINDPFGGNDGLNMAIVVPNGPVQILSPGYRNAYDLVVTESGALYVTDNGANQGWGGFPANEGGGSVTNNYINPQPGDTSPDTDGEFINNVDHLQLVTTDLSTYDFNNTFYGGHPNPIRANPQGAGLYTNNNSVLGTTGAPIWRTQVYDPDGSTPGSTTNINEGLPANWPPVQTAKPIEGDWRGPGINNPEGANDNPVVTWGTNTNSIDEYTASNFGGALQGNLLAGHSGGNIRRVILSTDGASGTLQPNFFSGIGGNVLGLTCNSDTDIFPGTVWAGTFNGIIVVMEPQDAFLCINPGDPGYSPLADNDGDGYTNQDEEDNETDPCNGGSQPSDFDKVTGGTLISDINDTDDDSDGITDALDSFQLGNPLTTGSDAFSIPIANDLFNDQQGLGGIFGLGMTGLMNNGDTGLNWLNWIDRRDDTNDPNPNDVLGGAPGIMTSHMTSGTALGIANTQEKGYQYGVQVDSNTALFSVIGGMNGFSGGSFRLYGNTAAGDRGELGFFIGDGTQRNYIKFVVTVDGFTVLQEIDDIPQPINGVPQETEFNVTLLEAQRPADGIRFYFIINPSNGEVTLEYQIDSKPRVEVTTVTAQGTILTAIQQNTSDLAVGFIGTSGTAGVELEGSWDFLNVLDSQPIISLELPDINRLIGSAPESINLNDFFADDGGTEALVYNVEQNTDSSIGAVISNNILGLNFPATPAISNITIRATDAENNFIEQNFTINVSEDFPAIYRVNTGGPEIPAIDGGIDWSEDTTVTNSDYLIEDATNFTYNGGNISSTTSAVDPTKVPLSIFASERSDNSAGAPNVTYAFPVAENGNYEVRLYMGNAFSGTSEPGERIFNATIEGNLYPDLTKIDLSASYGHEVGTMISHIVTVNDGVINISLIHDDIENPLINGIEITQASSLNTPIFANSIANQLGFSGATLDGSLGVVATGGDGNLQYDAVGLPPGVFIEPTNGQIGGNIGIDATENSPYTVTITIDDSDLISTDAVTIQFTWTVFNDRLVRFRLNAGGNTVSSSDGEIGWVANNTPGAVNGMGYTVNTGNVAPSLLAYENRHISIPSYIDEATYNAIFAQERWDSSSGQEMQFNIPLPNGDYIVNLFMGNYNLPTSEIGERIFNISVEGTLLVDNLDLIAEFGQLKGGMISLPVSLMDGEVNILFEHVTENPLINGIEIITKGSLIYNGIDWFPNAPDENIALDNAIIMSGEFTLTSDMEVNNLSVQLGGSLIVEPGNTITTHGDINVNGTSLLELRSSATSYAGLIANGTVNGKVIYKRHVNNNDIDATGSNDLIAPPLSGQAFNEFLINNSNIVSNSDNTLYLFGPFNKEIGAYDIYGASETATLNAGTGYRAASTDTGTFSFTGTVNTGDVEVTISNSGPAFQEWNLIGNPYPSYLNLATFLTTNITAFGTNSAAIYGYDGDASDGWTVWNQATAASHPDYLITPGQGFFVASEASRGPINFLPAMRVIGQSDDFIEGRSASSLPGFLKLGLNQNEKTYYTDFYFNPNASRGLDKGYDAQIWGGNAPNFSLFSYLVEDNAGLPMVIQSLGETDYADVQIPLGINANVGEQISISISENTLPSTIDVYLEDLLLQTTVLLNTSDYVLTPSNALSTTGRFFLRFTDSALSSETSLFNRLHVFNDSQNQSIVISGLITEPSIAKLYDVQGRQVISSVLHLNTSSQNIKVNGLEKGIYIISIESASEKMTQKLIIR
jgi:hypothetical protein